MTHKKNCKHECYLPCYSEMNKPAIDLEIDEGYTSQWQNQLAGERGRAEVPLGSWQGGKPKQQGEWGGGVTGC
jgi:hypothetical protein